MHNIEIRNRAKRCGVFFWEIAKEIGVYPSTFTVWMRTEMSDERRQKVEAAIDAIIARRQG